MKLTSLFVICFIAASTMAVDLQDIEDMELLAMDSADAFTDVQTLFDQLRAQSQGELTLLRTNWGVSGKALQETCTVQTGLANEKQKEVDDQQKKVDDYQCDKDACEDHIEWIDQRFIDNDEKLEHFKKKRCEANLLFVQHLTEHKQSLQAITMLKEILENMEEEDLMAGSSAILADLGVHKHSKHETKVLTSIYEKLSSLFSVMPNKIQTSFVQIGVKFDIDPDFDMLNDDSQKLAKKTYFAPKNFAVQTGNAEDEAEDAKLDAKEEALDENRDTYSEGYTDYEGTVDERTAEEIGDDQVDDKTDTMEMRNLESGTRHGFSELQQEILELLDNLQEHLEDSIDRMVEDEIEASSAFADWKILVENEEGALEVEREAEVTKCAGLTVTIAEETENLTALLKQLEGAKLQARTSCDAYDDAEEAFNKREKAKLEEIDLFGEVEYKYQKMQEGLSDQMKQRVNEGVEGGEMTDYDREVAG